MSRLFPVLFGVVGVLMAAVLIPVAIVLGEPQFWLVAVGVPALFIGFAGAALVRARQRKAGEAIGLSAGPAQVRRGERVDVRLQLPDADGEDLELTLMCTVRYDVRRPSDDGGHNRTTSHATAFTTSKVASGRQLVQSVAFEVPREAPFSHEGSCLSFAWQLRARQPRRGVDRVREEPLWVLP
jgi:hypothetical protein